MDNAKLTKEKNQISKSKSKWYLLMEAKGNMYGKVNNAVTQDLYWTNDEKNIIRMLLEGYHVDEWSIQYDVLNNTDLCVCIKKIGTRD